MAVNNENIISSATLNKALENNTVVDADFNMLRTSSESFRDTSKYWEYSPAFSPDLYELLSYKFHSFCVIGLDTIFISTIAKCELGREAHRVLLTHNIRNCEDLSLYKIKPDSSPNKIVALPFRYEISDGAPTTLFAETVTNAD